MRSEMLGGLPVILAYFESMSAILQPVPAVGVWNKKHLYRAAAESQSSPKPESSLYTHLTGQSQYDSPATNNKNQ